MAKRGRKGNSGSGGLIVLLLILACLVLTIVGVCISWVKCTVTVLSNETAYNYTLSDLFSLLEGVEGDTVETFKLMASFAIITVILAAATTVLAGICKVLRWKLFRFVLVIAAIVCVVCGVVTIITSYSFGTQFATLDLSDIFGFDLSNFANVETTPAVGVWLTGVGGMVGGLFGVVAAVRN